MSIETKDIKKVANLARIKLDDSEIEHFTKEVSNILNWVEQLQEVDTNNVPQMASTSTTTLPERNDEVTDGNCTEDILANAPSSNYNCFVVPKVVE